MFEHKFLVIVNSSDDFNSDLFKEFIEDSLINLMEEYADEWEVQEIKNDEQTRRHDN